MMEVLHQMEYNLMLVVYLRYMILARLYALLRSTQIGA